ncbi:TolC family protein [Oligosphaera ethanolica]|uniref:RpiB/LacA/LacB family sugar-phosphate isomerase n=1 Tax=Oligosphaera ethanolica TaxID=760260 RepID=A0AAE3VHK2_9BACT|nr:TolC family protein [Oligosphaera ethanolica]MDQ0290299.1 RpiB/LacA/LacB family sugar-phosphate isomerase [Oligosphaera ethanolica]
MKNGHEIRQPRWRAWRMGLATALAMVVGLAGVAMGASATAGSAPSVKRVIAIGSVAKAFALKEAVEQDLLAAGHEVIDKGCHRADDTVSYTAIGEAVAHELYAGRAEFGVVFCNFGCSALTGVSKFKGVIAFACESDQPAEMSRRANGANVLCLGQSTVTVEEAKAIVRRFISTEFVSDSAEDAVSVARRQASATVKNRGEVPRHDVCALPLDMMTPNASVTTGVAGGETAVMIVGDGEDGAGGLDLSQCIAMALANNPGLSRESWQVRGAESAHDVVKAARLPQLAAQAGASFYREDRMISPRREGDASVLAFSDELASAQLVMQLPLYTGGRLRSSVLAAELTSQAMRRQFAHSRAELVFNVSSLYYAILRQREHIGSLEFARGVLERHRQVMTDMLAARKAAQVDVLRTEVRLADLEQQLLRETYRQDVQCMAMAALLGIEGGCDNFHVNGQLSARSDVVSDADFLLQDALASRADYQALLARVEAQRQQVRAARARRYPDLSFRASYGNSWDMEDSEANEVGELGVVVSMPLFSGGGISAAIAREQALLLAAEESLRESRLRIQVELQSALADIHSTHARYDVTSKSVQQAGESLRIEQEKYKQGKGSITDVLDAQSALLSLQTSCYAALADWNTALARLTLVSGRYDDAPREDAGAAAH